MKNFTFLIIIIIFSLTSCSKNIFKRSDIKDNPVNVNERVKRNVEEGRGIRFGKSKNTGTFDFASSNELWRASINILDFVPFSNASYSGGILITEWFDGNSKIKNEKRDLKITVRFLSNVIRADALDISIHERKCKNTIIDCKVKKIKSKLESEIKFAILQKAALMKNNNYKSNAKEYRKKKRTTIEKKK